MKIVFDLDEVLNEFVRSFILFYEKKSGNKINFEDIRSYNFWENGIGKDREEAASLVNEFYNSEYYNRIVVALHSQEVVKEIMEKGHDIFIVTSRPDNIRERTKEFVKSNFSDKIEIIHSNDFFKEGKRSKAEIVKDLGAEIMVEDNLRYAMECSEKGIKVFLLNKPWNKQEIIEGDKNIIRVDDLNEVLRYMR